MNKLFKWIGSLIEKKPVKTLFVTVVLFAILIAGVSSMRLATGNETLVQDDNEVYISNSQMEESFGGNSILILFTDNTQGNLLSQENIQKMWNVEQKFKYEDNIFSFMSPASLAHQMTEMQSVEIKKQVLSLSDGLADMSSNSLSLVVGC
jgi:predicted RND superfamily exporter protein